MSASTAIGGVSASLRTLLEEEWGLASTVSVTILAPDEAGGSLPRINLFLYRVEENPFLRNQDWQVSESDSNQLVPPPLSLKLYYLMTPYATNDPDLGNVTRHEILGEAMRVFYEHPVVPERYLARELMDAREQIKIIQNGLNMEELSQVWSTFSEPFRPSVLYEVSVVQLDQSASRPMPPRVREIGTPEIGASHQPPVVDRMEPISGPPGTTLTFFGEHLAGWKAYVTLQRRRILEGADISGDSFQVELPADLALGFHELRVDVSHLFRRTFFFEVTR
ncbi:MAG: DUF4255 domain-containing protein [Gemmatimonadales bacterium]|nr:DUF4255 domain-containing protein [Gemmatimonadales bacterium]